MLLFIRSVDESEVKWHIIKCVACFSLSLLFNLFHRFLSFGLSELWAPLHYVAELVKCEMQNKIRYVHNVLCEWVIYFFC